MASIPLPALHLQQYQQPDTADQIGRLLQLRNMVQNAPLQRQILEQQAQQGQIQNQLMQRNLEASKALQAASANSMTKDASGNMSFDPEKFKQGIAGTAAFTPETIENLTKMQQSSVALQNSQADLQNKVNDIKGYAAAAVKAANYDPNVAHSLLDTMNVPPQQQMQLRAMVDNPQALKQWVDTTIAQSPKQAEMANQVKVAQVRAATPEMQGMQDWLAKNPGKGPADYQQHKIDLQTQADVARETNPQVMAAKMALATREAAAKQALSQGDPNAAGQLLVNGDATLSELKSRGATPDFISRALFAARKLSGGQYNAQQAEAQFDVAKSPSNTAFFGSAGSLVSKGGTLDQLQEAAKEIPQNQIPVFNTVEDAMKAATGNGPIAKYASLAVGAADDYSKVMGSGVGSDASRAQAWKLLGMNQSPAQRAGSIEGIRGAVNSQANSRIGDNPVMKRMYGSQFAGNSPAPKVTAASIPAAVLNSAKEGQYIHGPNGEVFKKVNGQAVPQQ